MEKFSDVFSFNFLFFTFSERSDLRRTYCLPFFFNLCRSTSRIGVAKNSNSSRSRFSIYLRYEKCSPARPPDVNNMNNGGLIPAWAINCTFNRDMPPLVVAGADPPLGCEIDASKKRLSCAVGMRRFLASNAFETIGKILVTL